MGFGTVAGLAVRTMSAVYGVNFCRRGRWKQGALGLQCKERTGHNRIRSPRSDITANDGNEVAEWKYCRMEPGGARMGHEPTVSICPMLFIDTARRAAI